MTCFLGSFSENQAATVPSCSHQTATSVPSACRSIFELAGNLVSYTSFPDGSSYTAARSQLTLRAATKLPATRTSSTPWVFGTTIRGGAASVMSSIAIRAQDPQPGAQKAPLK